MTAREVRLDLLLGRKVVDASGEVIGRLEEVVAEVRVDNHGSDHVVREFHVGKCAAAERLAGGLLGGAVLRLLTGGRGYSGYVVPWQIMDLSDPERPRVRGRKGELERRGLGGDPGRTTAGGRS
jgi:sporulation protein YlmC with PRC-barrel domain